MIKITAKNSHRHVSACTVLLALGLSACTPIPLMSLPQLPVQIPQGDPLPTGVQQQAQHQQLPQPRLQSAPQQQARTQVHGAVPVAGPATAVRQRYAQVPRPAAPANQQQPAPVRIAVAVPPVLNPVQSSVPVSNSQQQRAAPRSSASVSNAPTFYQDQTPARTAVAQAPASSKRHANTPRSRPSATARTRTVQNNRAARKPSKPAAATTRRMTVNTKPSAATNAVTNNKQAAVATKPTAKPVEKEVLDMSSSSQKPTAAVKAAPNKAAPAPSRSYTSSPAVSVLLKQANNDLSAGKNGRAAATLERALRISPDNPLLWIRLAEVNARQGNKAQAASMARKAMNLAPSDSGLKARGQRLLN